MKLLFATIILSSSLLSISQNISPEQLVEKAIEYHDPKDNWPKFKAQFIVEMETPNASKRIIHIRIDLLNEHFAVRATRDSTITVYSITKGNCTMVHNGKNLDSISAKEYKMSCERAELYKNYYTYLYGLPMKLKDTGTHLDDTVEKRTFKGKDYLVLKVTYDKSVGSDVWYFYFDPQTYAMEVYQFYKTDKKGKIKPNSGEYILLSEESMVNNIKMPKIRTWYYNKDDKYLGTDTLSEH